MRMTHWLGIGAAVVTVMGLLTWNSAISLPKIAVADSSASAKNAPRPVEDDMHEFMEYVFQPTYKRLKAAMAAEPSDKSTWKAIKSDALILAEGGNLLLFRDPEGDVAVWVKHSVMVRELGGKLYRSAGKKDYKSARQNYTSMLIKCNSCHDTFAEGEHQLKP